MRRPGAGATVGLLVRLDRIAREELGELLEESHRIAAGPER